MKTSANLPIGSTSRGGSNVAGPRIGAGSSSAAAESLLERNYPGVVRALTMMWGHPELTEFLDRVATGLDPRLRDIEPAAMAELMLLAQLHKSFCPRRTLHLNDDHPAARGTGAWRPALQRG
jgi:hypothetical protein